LTPGRELGAWEGAGVADQQPSPVIEAASSSDPRGHDPWPERDRTLVAVFAGAGVRMSATQVYLAVIGSGLEQTAMANPAPLLRTSTPPSQVDPPTAK
jgi:hypothetical protein